MKMVYDLAAIRPGIDDGLVPAVEMLRTGDRRYNLKTMPKKIPLP